MHDRKDPQGNTMSWMASARAAGGLKPGERAVGRDDFMAAVRG